MQTTESNLDRLVEANIAQTRLLRTLVADMAALRAELRRTAVTSCDSTQTELVEAAHATFPGATFLAADLLAAALRLDAAGARLARLLSDRNPRSLGKLLSAAAGKRTTQGLVLRRLGEHRTGSIWGVSLE